MIRYLLMLIAVFASPASAQIVTSPVELVDNSPKTPGIVIVSAKTTPQVKKGVTVFACSGGPP